jgi:hypothetical protein
MSTDALLWLFFPLALGKSLTTGAGVAQTPQRFGHNLLALLDRPDSMELAGNQELGKGQELCLLLRWQCLTELGYLFWHVHTLASSSPYRTGQTAHMQWKRWSCG